MRRGKFRYGRGASYPYQFPLGYQFKIIVVAWSNAKISIDAPQNVFLDETVPPNATTLPLPPEKESFLPIPLWAKNFSKSLPERVSGKDYTVAQSKDNILEKCTINFICPPMNMLLHVTAAERASVSLVKEQQRGTYSKNAGEWVTIGLIRLAKIAPTRITPVVWELFTKMVVAIELFDVERFANGKFPFSLDAPITDPGSATRKLEGGVETEVKSVISKILKTVSLRKVLCARFKVESKSKRRHLLSGLNIHHQYIPKPVANQVLKCPSKCIVCINDFQGVYERCFAFKNSLVSSPLIFSSKNPETVSCVVDSKRQEISVLGITEVTNEWVVGSAFELILVMKSLAFACASKNGRITLKTAAINCYLAMSPFIMKYTPEICEFIQRVCPPSPLDND